MIETKILHESATQPGELPDTMLFITCDVCRWKTMSYHIASSTVEPDRHDPDAFIESILNANHWFLRNGNHVCPKCDRLFSS